MARPVERIDPTLDKLRKTWYSNPELRLGQLIMNLQSDHAEDLYYIEDDELVKRLGEVYDYG